MDVSKDSMSVQHYGCFARSHDELCTSRFFVMARWSHVECTQAWNSLHWTRQLTSAMDHNTCHGIFTDSSLMSLPFVLYEQGYHHCWRVTRRICLCTEVSPLDECHHQGAVHHARHRPQDVRFGCAARVCKIYTYHRWVPKSSRYPSCSKVCLASTLPRYPHTHPA